MRTMRRPLILTALLCALLPGAGIADDRQSLFAAARAGDLAEVRRLVGAGLSVDSADKYGTTALYMAAGRGHSDVVRFLLDSGADPNLKESFYGTSPLVGVLFMGAGDGSRAVEIARLLLEHGAEDREQALAAAIQRQDPDLARAAVDSGPILESALARLRAPGAGDAGPALSAILERAESRPDPPPPVYKAADLEPFIGRFEGFATSTTVEVSAADAQLLAAIDGGEPQPLEATGEREFRSAEDGAALAFFGRAGTIEGIQLTLPGAEPDSLRRSVAEPLGLEAFSGAAADQPEGAVGPTVNWPAFRGAAARGVGDGLDTLTSWSLETGDGVLWTAELPGLGNSSPVVWGDTVFITTAVAVGAEQKIRTGLTGAGDPVDEPVEHRWLVLAYDKRSGVKLWEREVGRAVPLTRRHFKATQANSTPVTDGEHLVVVFPTAGMACLGLDGEIHWRKELGGLNAGAFSDPGIEWGFASSPLLYGSLVIQQVDVHGGPFVAAWDLESGAEVWRAEREVAPSWATPNVLPGPSGDELVVNGSTIHGYDPKTGRELWSLSPNSELVIATPVIGGGVAYVSAGYPPVKPIYAIEPGLRGEHRVDPAAGDPSLAWSQGIGGAYMPTPLLYRGLLYVVHHNGRLVAYDAATGAAIYKSRFSGGGTFTGSPIAVNGKLYAGTEEGQMYVLEAGPEYRELAINEMSEPLMATPAVSEGVLLVRTPSRLIAIGEPPSESQAEYEESDFLSRVRRLTFEGRRAGEGYFSPDGAQLVFQSEREEGNPFFQIYLLDMATGESRLVSPGTGKTTCAFIRPGSGEILFGSTHHDPRSEALQRAELEARARGEEKRYAWDYDPEMEIWVAADGGYRRLTEARGYDAEGSYSPDGEWIVFSSMRDAYNRELSAEEAKMLEVNPSYFGEIYLMRADGSGERRLTDAPGYDGGPFFFPDGSKIVWRRFDEEGLIADVWTMNPDGTDQRRITDFGSMSWAPYAHPSGKYIFFASNKLGFTNFEIYIVDTDGTKEPVRVTYTDGFDGLPVPSPDGTKLAWTSTRHQGEGGQLYLADWNHRAALEALERAPRRGGE